MLASVGHIKDLPKAKLAVNIAKNFEPEYEIIQGKGKIIQEIKRHAKAVDIVYLAPDPDREGEAIAWHLAEEIRPSNGNIKRILFNEITKRGITDAIAQPLELDRNKFDSQQTRRILDRLVGYQISPILWKKVRRGLSAGRVQSVAVRIIVERETEIAAFKSMEYWTIEAGVEGAGPPPFRVKLAKLDGEAAKAKAVATGDEARAIAEEIRQATLTVERVEKKERRKNPQAPFITSRLQQEAARKLRFTAKKTMTLAQRLYEGLELGEEGPVGLITYMRTDSTRLSDDAVAEARAYIAERYGAESLPDEAVVYKTKKSAQDAHEAIRPTSMKYEPDTVRKLLLQVAGNDRDKADDFEDFVKLYALIWNRFVACQMKPAVYDATTIDVAAANGRATLRASGQVLKFAGFTAVYEESKDETVQGPDTAEAEIDEGPASLPDVAEGERLSLKDINPEQHFTQPPPRFTEASLVKELEDKGIGRPSTYAAILSTVQDRGYVEKKEGRFFPTMLGTKVNELLIQAFPDIFDVTFTASMEEDLDKVSEGEADWQKLLHRFYKPFKEDLDHADEHMRDLKREEIPTEHICEKDGSPMVIKWGRNGEFLACTGYTTNGCKNTKEFVRNPDGTITIVVFEVKTTDEKCPLDGGAMVVKRGRFGEFLACTNYPDCKGTKPISLGVDCPKCKTGFISERRSRKGKVFFGCSNYSKTKCDFVLWDRPFPSQCPQCDAKFLVKKVSKRGDRIRCVTEGCGYTLEPEGGAGAGAGEDAAEGDAA